MDLAKLVVAIGIGLFLCLFISEGFSLVYPFPDYNNPDIYSYSNTCRDLITVKCGDSSSSVNYTAYYGCTNEVYTSSEYKQCTENQQKSQKSRLESYQNKVKFYQIISLITFGLLGVLAILIGFFAIGKRSIGSGLILGGIFLIPFGAMLSTVTSLLSKGLSYFGGSGADTALQTITQIIRVVGYALVLFILILMAYFKLEKKGGSED
ncbi:MAG: hypothetical protein Q8Q31_01495 [Nanoarchaeota archaeon]|nr:hypothetical protein [Nanoarchaeota archaeon]